MIQLSGAFTSECFLSEKDRVAFSSIGYVILQLAPECGSFVLPNSLETQQVEVASGSFQQKVLVRDPDNCDIRMTFFGKRRGSGTQDHNVFTGLLAAAADMFTGAFQPGIDHSQCAQMGSPVSVDVVAAAKHGYMGRITFGQNSRLSGLRSRAVALQYKPLPKAVASSWAQAAPHESSVQQDDVIPSSSDPTAASSVSQQVESRAAAAGEQGEGVPPSAGSTTASTHAEAFSSPSSPVPRDRLHLRTLLRQQLALLQDSCTQLSRLQDSTKGFTTIEAPPDPADIEPSKAKSIKAVMEQEQQELRSSTTTLLLKRLDDLSDLATAEVEQLLSGCAGFGSVPSRSCQEDHRHMTIVQTAAQQLCSTLSSCMIADLAIQIRSLRTEVGKSTRAQHTVYGVRAVNNRAPL